MKNRKIGKVTVMGFAILIVLVVVILMSNSLRRSSRIVLPDTVQPMEDVMDAISQENASITPVSVTPETVQSAIESLRRPASYRRTITVERLWEGGSGTSEVEVSVANGWTRTDVTPTGGRTRHTITDGETTYIWYGGQSAYYQGAAGDITADQEQGIPTYEDVLALSVSQIETADYRVLSGINCIYVETGEDDNGYVVRYWVSVDTGLLAVTEWLENGQSIYRAGSPGLDTTAPATEDFTLPDGTVLTQVA